jgi:hypothetical protein
MDHRSAVQEATWTLAFARDLGPCHRTLTSPTSCGKKIVIQQFLLALLTRRDVDRGNVIGQLSSLLTPAT